MLCAEPQPAPLVVLQPVTRALDLDHPVAALIRIELDQIRHARAVRAKVQQQTLAPQLQMFGRQAVQRLIEQLCAEYAPVNERSEERRVGKECRSRWSRYR